tara:strand:- start:116 stop:382 length:267 start_codon:yes stop_codon:yes gene_type:complete
MSEFKLASSSDMGLYGFFYDKFLREFEDSPESELEEEVKALKPSGFWGTIGFWFSGSSNQARYYAAVEALKRKKEQEEYDPDPLHLFD